MREPTCPYCKSTDVEAVFVDIGVGSEQATPYVCNTCHAVQIGPYDTDPRTEEEERIGWRKGIPDGTA